MENFYNETFRKLKKNIGQLEIELDNPILLAEAGVDLVMNCLSDVKKFVINRGFNDEEEEIYFFKRLKPNILSKLIYYNSIYRIETKKPFGSSKTIKKYIYNELDKIKRYFDNNLEFYKYYRTNSNYLDHKFFVRGKHDIKLSLNTYYFVSDQTFSTSHDYKVAKIIANDLIQVYLEGQLCNINKKHLTSKHKVTGHLNWTESKTSLIELIYALHTQAVFDKGKTDIKLIAKSFESIFNIDLGDFYHTYLELKNRKVNRTKFLDSLREGLNKKIDEQDEK